MRRIEAEFEIVTPMFLGGADNANVAELRVPSIKAALRFWWRMQAWSRIAGGTNAEKLRSLRQAENRIFGGAGEGFGQSRFLLRLTTPEPLQVLDNGTVLFDNSIKVLPGARYLGYGLMGAFGADAAKLTRPCIRHRQKFSVELLFRRERNSNDDEFENDYSAVLGALRLFGLLGGLGARSRRGWGSIALVDLKDANGTSFAFESPSERHYIDQIRRFLGASSFQDSLPPHTAFSTGSRVSLVRPDPALIRDMGLNSVDRLTSLQGLAAVGTAMILYRSNGKNRRVQLQDADPPVWTSVPVMPGTRVPRFWDDHQWFYGQKMPPGFHPDRIVFGLPQNYFRQNTVDGRRVRFFASVSATGRNRRASPLFIHIHRIGDEFVAVLMVLPAQFLPAGDNATLAPNGGPVPVAVDFGILTDFIGSPYFTRTRIY